MKAMILRTYTADTEKTWKSFEYLGHDCDVHVYDDRPHDRQNEFVEHAQHTQPHMIMYIGAIEQYHGRPVLQPDILKRLNDIAPMVHICGDASDRPWWEWLQLYHDQGCFSAQVSIDGVFNTPLTEHKEGLVLLTPTIPSAFIPTDWDARNIQASMAGGLGHGQRAELVANLHGRGAIEWMDSRDGRSYDDMAEFMCRSRIVVNSPMNGTGDADHVKGRVIECGWAGACLLERVKSPTRRWFQKGLEYLEYSGVEDALKKIEWAREHDAEVKGIAARFRQRVMFEHSPGVFWDKVLKIAGVPA